MADMIEREVVPGFRATAKEDGTYRLDRYTGHESALIVPTQLNGVDVTEIGEKCFAGNSYLTRVSLAEGITAIGREAFSRCFSLREVMLPKTLEKLGEGAFRESGLASIELPPRIEAVPPMCFRGCTSLEEVRPNENLWRVEREAFYGCEKLLGVDLPDGLEELDELSFAHAGLVRMALPRGLTRIGREAFAWCTRLIQLSLPDELEIMEDGACAGCIQLETIALPAALTELGVNPFRFCTHLSAIDVAPENDALVTQDGALFLRRERVLISYPLGLREKRYAFPAGLYEIGDYAFCGAGDLERLRLPMGLRRIGEGAFRYCDRLQRVHMPDTVQSIGHGAFRNCQRLDGVVVKKGSFAHEQLKAMRVNCIEV